MGPGRSLATFFCLLLPSLHPLMFESVSPLTVSLSLVDMLFLVFLSVFSMVCLRASRSTILTDAVSGRLLTDAVSGRLLTDAVSGRLLTDAVSGRLLTDAVSGRLLTDAVSGRLLTDAVSGRRHT